MRMKTYKYQVQKTFPIFFWERCFFCGENVILERMYYSQIGFHDVFSCKTCSSSPEVFCENYDNTIKNLRPTSPPPAPPTRKVHPRIREVV